METDAYQTKLRTEMVKQSRNDDSCNPRRSFEQVTQRVLHNYEAKDPVSGSMLGSVEQRLECQPNGDGKLNISMGGWRSRGLWPVGGVLHQIFSTQFQQAKKNWTLSDPRFCGNEGSNSFKINEKGGQLDRKSRRKLILNP